MFDRKEMEEAVEIQDRAYKLLQWLAKAIKGGIIKVATAHDYTSDSEAAGAWIEEHMQNIPAACRPASDSQRAKSRFACYFASYLKTSFELVAEPGVHLRSDCGCMCWCCSYLVAAPHLKPRRLTSRDKKRAVKVRQQYLRQLALDLGLVVPAPAIEKLASKDEIAKDLALAAYGAELLARCAGRPSGPAALVLWRQFAWTKSGSPDPKFKLRADRVLQAESHLAQVLQRAA